MEPRKSYQLKIIKSDAEWHKQLSPKQYEVTRNHGTERAFSSPDFDTTHPGIFHCVCCDQKLFRSAAKYDSGTGWPSFFEPIDSAAIRLFEDHSYGMHRMEVRCSSCDAHLGHLFQDGPPPTGLRYCMNGVALTYDITKETK